MIFHLVRVLVACVFEENRPFHLSYPILEVPKLHFYLPCTMKLPKALFIFPASFYLAYLLLALQLLRISE